MPPRREKVVARHFSRDAAEPSGGLANAKAAEVSSNRRWAYPWPAVPAAAVKNHPHRRYFMPTKQDFCRHSIPAILPAKRVFSGAFHSQIRILWGQKEVKMAKCDPNTCQILTNRASNGSEVCQNG